MSDESAHGRMEQYEELAEQERQSRRQREALLDDIAEELTDSVEQAATETTVSAEVVDRSGDGIHQTIRARLDRAALVAAVTDYLPDGFVVEHVNDDGTLTVQWDERETVSAGREASAILKAIVAEETITDEDGLIEAVATRDQVVARAVELGVDEDRAERRLARLADLEVVDIIEGEVYPDSNFSKF